MCIHVCSTAFKESFKLFYRQCMLWLGHNVGSTHLYMHSNGICPLYRDGTSTRSAILAVKKPIGRQHFLLQKRDSIVGLHFYQRKSSHHLTFQQPVRWDFYFRTSAGNSNISDTYPGAGWYSIEPNLRKTKSSQHTRFQYGISGAEF